MNHDGIKDYSTDTLLMIERDLTRNPASKRAGTWERSRLKAIRKVLIERVGKRVK